MKQITSAFLLCLFLLHIVGYYPLFLLLNSENETQMMARMEDERFTITLRLHKSEVKNSTFPDKEKELLYNGEMYDVKSSFRDGDFIVFQCIQDKTEKTLLAGLQNNVNYNTDSNSHPEKKQNDPSKNPVKELFLHQNYKTEVFSIAIVFPYLTDSVTSYIPPTLPLPPPEISFS